MDEIKRENSAIEKVESIINQNKGQKEVTVSTEFEKNPAVTVENTTTVTVDKDKLKKQKLKRIKENAKAKKQRVNQKTEEVFDKKSRAVAEKQAKMQMKAQKIASKTALKKAKALEKAKLKQEKAEGKAYLKRVKAEQKHEHKLRESDRKERRGNNRRNRGIGGWLAAVISLGCSVLILGSLLTLSLFTDYMEFGKVNTNSANSQKAFYDFVGYVDNIETNMSKMFISQDGDGQQKILSDLAVQSSLADASLSSLPIMDESKYLTSKYINQVYDYSKYLNNRLIDGDKLTEEEMQNFKNLYEINKNLKQVLSSLSADLGESYDFSALAKNDTNDKIISQFKDIEESMMDYPEMIYDGPFSDGLLTKKAKGLSGEEINELKAKEIFTNLFKEYGVEKVEVKGTVENGAIICYNISADTKKNGEVYAQISKQGGKLIMFNAYRDCSGLEYSEEQCVALAEDFLQKQGLSSMQCVWAYSSGSTEYLNFAYTENGTIFYPDLIKVKVCRERGVVSGVDADGYYMNHAERKIETPKYSIGDAYEKASQKLDVLTYDISVIPTGGGNERLAYEFIGEYNGSTYYLYLDSNTLKQVEIYKVVETEQGRLLV